MLMRVPADVALGNLRSSRSGRWFETGRRAETSLYAAKRLAERLLVPDLKPKFTFTKQSRIYGMGSCFVREIERVLMERGFNLPPHPGVELAAKWQHVGEVDVFNQWVAAGYLNKYNTYAMLYEARRACLGPEHAPDMVVPLQEDAWTDICATNMLSDSSESAVRERRAILDAHSRHMRHCDVFILTLGLTEGWYNRAAGVHVNDHGGAVSYLLRGDFEFVVLDFDDHIAALDELYRVVKGCNPRCQFIVTVSPVPLQATFTGMDVVLANTYSKSTLRSVAGAFCATHGDTDYFPSYEMVTLSDPSIAWQPDRRHVQRAMVAHIAELFTKHYLREEATEAASA